MDWIKATGLLLVAMGCWGLGIGQCKQLRKRVQLLDGCVLLLQELERSLLATRPLLPQLLSRLSQTESLKGLSFLQTAAEEMQTGCSFEKAWLDALAPSQSQLQPPERQLLEELTDFLGRTDAQSAADALHAQQERMTRLLNAAREELAQKNRLYPSIGLLGGLFLVLLLI